MAGLEDKLDCLGILGPLQQQLAVLESEVKKLMSIAPALEALRKIDFGPVEITVVGLQKNIEGSYAATKDGVIANGKEQIGSALKQILDRLGSARETASENVQK